MFENSGQTIQNYAKVIFWLGTLPALGISIAAASNLADFDSPMMIILGILLIILYFALFMIGIWIFTSFIYAFGKITEKVEKMSETNEEIKALLRYMVTKKQPPQE